MNDEELKAIEERASRATPPPWNVSVEHCECGGENGCAHPPEPYELEAPARQVETIGGFKRAACLANFLEGGDCTAEDAEFIGHARTDVPALIAEVRRLQSELSCARAEALEEAARKAYNVVAGWSLNTGPLAIQVSEDIRGLAPPAGGVTAGGEGQ